MSNQEADEGAEVFANGDDCGHELMFICGAQTTPEGDMLPASFTVFSKRIESHDAVQTLLKKIGHDLDDLGIEYSEGSLAFQFIDSWEDFAALEIDDSVKTKALISAIMEDAADLIGRSSGKFGDIVTRAWLPYVES